MGKQESPLDRNNAKHLGIVIKRMRIAQEIPAARLAKMAGLSRSYLSYLEAGERGMGLDKFVRIVTALGVDPDEVLREAGYLPPKKRAKLDPIKVLREGFDLTLRQAESAAAFVGFLKTQRRSA
jgi:transcriptional regulator with XRE-family HTH domain